MSGITPKSLLSIRRCEQSWISLDQFQSVMLQIGLHGIMENNLLPCIKAVREMRCFEDYDKRNSNAKKDFYRRWYHTRSRISSVSLDSLIEAGGSDSLDNYVGDLSAQYEDAVCAKLDAEKFYRSLKPLDR